MARREPRGIRVVVFLILVLSLGLYAPLLQRWERRHNERWLV